MSDRRRFVIPIRQPTYLNVPGPRRPGTGQPAPLADPKFGVRSPTFREWPSWYLPPTDVKLKPFDNLPRSGYRNSARSFSLLDYL